MAVIPKQIGPVWRATIAEPTGKNHNLRFFEVLSVISISATGYPGCVAFPQFVLLFWALEFVHRATPDKSVHSPP